MARSSKKRRGRPPIAREAKRSRNFTFRSREAMHDQLVQAATRAGRSISEEIEFRLEQSFLDRQSLMEVLMLTYEPELAGMTLSIAEAMRDAAQGAGFYATYTLEGSRAWWNNPYAFEQAFKAAQMVLNACRPPGDIQEPAPLKPLQVIGDPIPFKVDWSPTAISRGLARNVLEEIATGHTVTPDRHGHRPEMLRRMLRGLVQRIADYLERDEEKHQ